MRVLLCTSGSTGDLNPFLALGRALARAGHAPVVLTPRDLAARARTLDLPVLDSESGASEAGYESMLRAVMGQRDPLEQARTIFEHTAAEHLRSVAAARSAVRGADVVVANAMDFAAVAAAEAEARPLVTVHLFPTLLPARGLAPTGRSLGRIGNAVAWKVAARMSRRLTDEPLNRVRAAFGLPPREGALFDVDRGARATLLAVSPQVVPPDAARPDRLVQTGYWFLDEPDATVDPALARFVAGGEPPVVVSFGSMSGVDREKVTDALIEGLRRSRRRAVLQAGWAGLGDGRALPANVFRAGYVPHGWLLPRASCLVHHGGAGTTAAAFRAGIPQVVVWHMGDQPFWGARVHVLGAGSRPIHHRKLTPRRLARRVDAALGDPRIAGTARRIGALVRAEDGLAAAVLAIERTHREAGGGEPHARR